MFREKFKVQMWRLLFVVVYTICFSISVSATQQTAIYNVESYSDILDIRCTPYSNDYFTGGFSDLGSWMCFTLPSENNWINGFCGPFELLITGNGYRMPFSKSDLLQTSQLKLLLLIA